MFMRLSLLFALTHRLLVRINAYMWFVYIGISCHLFLISVLIVIMCVVVAQFDDVEKKNELCRLCYEKNEAVTFVRM